MRKLILPILLAWVTIVTNYANARNVIDPVKAYQGIDSLLGEGVDVTKFGVKGDTLAASAASNVSGFTAAISYAKAVGIRKIILPAGYYYINARVDFSGVSVIGQGSKVTTIDGSLGTATDYPEFGTLYATGVETSIGKITAAAPKGRTAITVSSPVTLKAGDIIQIRDTTSYSFSFIRPQYKEQEFFVVKSDVTAGTTINLDHAITGGFNTVANTLVYKIDIAQNDVKGITLVSNNNVGMDGLRMEKCGRSRVEDVVIYNSYRQNFRLDNCYDMLVDHIFSKKLNPEQSASPTSYGLVLYGCQNIQVTNSDLYGARHAISTTGAVNRFLLFQGNTTSSTEEFSFNLHGSTQYATITGNNMLLGFSAGGKDIVLSNNVIRNETTTMNGRAISILEANGVNWTISGNNIFAKYVSSGTPNGMNIRFDQQVDTTGTFTFTDNKVTYDNTAEGATATAYVFRAEYNSGTADIQARFNISDNQWFTTNHLKTVQVSVLGTSTTGRFKEATFSRNIGYGVALQANNVINVNVLNNVLNETKWYGLSSGGAGTLNLGNNSFNQFCLSPTISAGLNVAYRIINATTINRWGNTLTAPNFATNSVTLSGITNLNSGQEITPGVLTENKSTVTNEAFVKSQSAVNTTTTALTSSALNTLYPTATTGYRVICAQISTGPVVYIKGDGTNWISTNASTVL